MTPEPIFLFSLPRAGSTLVQRVLATQPEVATVPEPWLLLPQLFTLQKQGWHADYGHWVQVDAFEDFVTHLPGGKEDYMEELRQFMLRLYRRASSDDARYFLDKTPRYHIIARQIMELFPEARFIFLWRQPLAVASSISETWLNGRWRLDSYRIDLVDGLDSLIRAASSGAARRVHTARYEDLVLDPLTHWPKLYAFLDLPFDPAVLEKFTGINLHGRMGDPTGQVQYSALSREPLEKWKASLCNPVRKRWALRYLEWIGPERMAAMGYDLPDLLAQVHALEPGRKQWWIDFKRIRRSGWPPYGFQEQTA